MGIEELKARARAKASTVQVDAADAGEVLRTEAMLFFSKVPEPPVYRRRDDPAIAKARALTIEGETLLASAYALEQRGASEKLSVWVVAIERHLTALTLLREGKIEAAEGPWHDAVQAERVAAASKRLWSRSDNGAAPVFDRAKSSSRFDPKPEASMKVKLVCPSCKQTADYSCSPRHAMHAFACHACRNLFSAYFAEVRVCEVTPRGQGRRYVFRLDELSGAQTQLHVDDWGRDALTVARRDLLAFLYAPATRLQGVLNMSSSRVLWLTPSRCFVATVAFGEQAPELDVLRAFRDQTLSRSAAGRAFTRWYYREGAELAAFVERRPVLRAVIRSALLRLVAVIRRSAR